MEKRPLSRIYSEDEPFPASQEAPEGIIEVEWTDTMPCEVEIFPNIVYQELSGEQQHIHLITPHYGNEAPAHPYPVIVFVRGSAWHRQKSLWRKLTLVLDAVQLHGYAVAMVEVRPSDIATFPAPVEDVKSAVRFLRAHADEYALDKERFGLAGGSSGAYDVVFAGITGDDWPNGTVCPEESCAVKCVVDWYGPSFLSEMPCDPTCLDHAAPDSPENILLGTTNMLDEPEKVQKANPLYYLSADKYTPPMLIMHGDADRIVPFHQSVLLYNKLKELNKEVTFIKLRGADHGSGGFLCPECVRTVCEFFDKHLK